MIQITLITIYCKELCELCLGPIGPDSVRIHADVEEEKFICNNCVSQIKDVVFGSEG